MDTFIRWFRDRWVLAVYVAIVGVLVFWVGRMLPAPGQLLVLLMSAGALGGLAQALITGEGQVRYPGPSSDGKGYDFGIAADLLIGAISAAASLVIGLALLNDRFFVSSDTAKSPADSRKDAEPIESIPTPLRVFSLGILVGYAGRKLLPSLSEKITDVVVGQVRKAVAEETKVQRETMSSQAAIGQTRSAAVGLIASGQVEPATARDIDTPHDPIALLAPIVGEYMAITPTTHPAYDARVQAKMNKAARMLAVTLSDESLTPSLVRSRILPNAADRDGWILATVMMVADHPTANDASIVLDVADMAVQKFVRYRILLAITALELATQLDASQQARALRFAKKDADSEDEPLRRKAQAVVALLRQGM